MLNQIKEAAGYISQKLDFSPEIGIILGTGLGALVDDIDIQASIDYEDIPHFPTSTVESHKGRLIFGSLSGKKVVVMQGRFHFYEGYNMNQVVFPVRVMKLLGIQKLFVSNACGSVNPDFRAGSLMVIADHINLLPSNPLIGPNIDELGPRFPDMSEPYDRAMIRRAMGYGGLLETPLHKGVYVSVSGPVLETKAEYDYLRTIGADVVGMSTVPEIIAARHMGLPCFAVSVITDEGFGELEPLTVEKVVAVAMRAQPSLTKLMIEMLKDAD